MDSRRELHDMSSMKLNYWESSWPLRVRQCPCDAHFVEYLQQNRISDRMIFHFGTGSHHLVGKANAESPERNEVLGITASRREYLKYIDYVIKNPEAAKYYKVIFADIYTLTPRCLPNLDIVSLFHLFEFYSPEQSAYAPLDDAKLVDLFLSKLNPDGQILFYKYSGKGSNVKTRMLLQAAEQAGEVSKIGEFKSLLIYRPGKAVRTRAHNRDQRFGSLNGGTPPAEAS